MRLVLYKLPPRIAHMRLADNPGRHEPGTGEINFDYLCDHIDHLACQGWIGCEYRPATTTMDGLGWLCGQRARAGLAP